MCGIVGYIGDKNAIPILLEGLKRLEYRGYDSAGLAFIQNSDMIFQKTAGRIKALEELIQDKNYFTTLGIGHTRWATHGEPTNINAHPHVDCTGKIAVVHNGIIENFSELKLELENNGHNFVSKTDTEVIAHLIEENLEKNPELSLADAVTEAVKRLEGSYAIAVLSMKEPDKIVCARNESPLVLGVGENSIYCASDIPAFLQATNKAVMINDGELVVLSSKGYEIRKIRDSTVVTRQPEASRCAPPQCNPGYPGKLRLCHKCPEPASTLP